MKKFTLLAVAGKAIAFNPAFAQTEDAPATAAAAIGEAPAADVNTSNADETAKVEALQTDQTSADGKWGTLDDTARFLSIMCTADGFSAAGDGSPCFPGHDNNQLDLDLQTAAFDTTEPSSEERRVGKACVSKYRSRE